jgi:hypothetical protein
MAKTRIKKDRDISSKELIRSKVLYYGTTIGNNPLSRYKEDDLYDRGFGELWLTKKILYFKRYLTMTPFEIRTSSIRKVSVGHGHAGKITLELVLKIHWIKDGQLLVSGFAIQKRQEDLLRWQKRLMKVLMK